ncbi:signal peptidase I [candidate division KSB1 bacterium]|nr:signal peptidase I [candidate division KSB1 bacterium]
MAFIYLILLVFYIWVGWKIFVKAGKPGWAVIIPFYNIYVLLEIVGRPGWWLILFLIPFVNIIIGIIIYVDLAKAFGKGTGFALGLIFLGFIFFPILAFGSAKYVGPVAAK